MERLKMWNVSVAKEHRDCLSSAVVLAETAVEAEKMVRDKGAQTYDKNSEINFDLPYAEDTLFFVDEIPMDKPGVVHAHVWWS